MSIIYDALQKTQKNLKTKRNISWIDIILFLIIICLLILVIISYYPRIKKEFIKNIVASSMNTPVAANKQSELTLAGVVLSGVFISDSEKIALINAHPHHVGDIIDGKKIISIEYDQVKLQDDKNIFILHTAS